jgi:FSR family fosmidomycin resistance protein-like MFS transporter
MTASTHTWRLRDTVDLLLIATTHGLSDGFASLLVPVLALIVADLGLSTVQAGLLLSVRSVATFVLLYPLSMLADTTGRKKGMLIAGLALAAGAYLAMGWARSLVPLAALAFLAGAGNATYHPCGTAITAKRFQARKAVAISFHGLGGNLGTSLMPLLQSAVVTVAGWRAAIAACVLPAGVLLPLVGVRFPGRDVAPSVPGSKTEDESRPPERRAGVLTARVLSNRNVVLLALVYALQGLCSKGLIGLLPLLAVERFAMDTPAIGVVVSVYYTVGIFSKALMGLLYNRWGARLALLLPLLLGGAFALGVGLLPWQGALLPLAALLGLVIPISPIILTAAADLCEEEILASSVGVIYTAYGLGFLSPLIGGWLATQFGWAATYAFFAAMTWAGAGVSTLLPATRRMPLGGRTRA